MKLPAVKGTRDFYPQDMAIRNFLLDGWKAASLRNGFQEYDAPILEHLKLFQIKSGNEIVEQLFSLTDRGGRDLALRAEITPSLARMVNQRINTLPKPIKWFSLPRLCRAERPQRGRLREFFQWNIDIIGADSVLADAEVIFCAIDYLRQVGLTAKDIVVRISSREILAAVLEQEGIKKNNLDALYNLLDKRAKMPADKFAGLLLKNVPETKRRDKITQLMDAKSLDELSAFIEPASQAQEPMNELKRLFELLEIMGVGRFCEFDMGIVRGLDYYTGVVFEIYDRESKLRAIGGGGRYDNLLKLFGGPSLPATGFGIGDCVLQILLEQKGLLGKPAEKPPDYFLARADRKYLDQTVELAAKLRQAGSSAVFSYKSASLGKQLRQASAQQALNTIILGEELENDQLVIKNMDTGEQRLVQKKHFLEKIAPRKQSKNS